MAISVWTIGYEKSSIDDFFATLQENGVEIIVDIREIPNSRKKGFSKNSLSAESFRNGMRYIHIRQLGDPKEGRIAAKNGNYSKFKKIYKYHLSLEKTQDAIDYLYSMANDSNCCLLCYEKDHLTCHRNLVVEELARKGGVNVQHLVVVSGASGVNEWCRQNGERWYAVR